MSPRSAAIITVGTELTEGLRLDTNSQEVAHALSNAGLRVLESLSVADDRALLADVMSRLCSTMDLVVVTGGLGPTHDDVTRDAAADALGVGLERDEGLVAQLLAAVARHTDDEAREQVLVQALVLPDAEVIEPTTGTAPGQIVATPGGFLALLPGPPREMRPMLERVVARFGDERAEHRELGIVGMTESDVQVRVHRAMQNVEGVGFTVLARPGDVRAIFVDEGGGAAAVRDATGAAAFALGDACYSRDGATLAEVVVREATARHVTVALAESCTGGMIAAALTDVPGASAVLLGGVVSYSNESKERLLGVEHTTLERHGAVSAETVEQMAIGALEAFGADLVVAVSGIAGPDGGTPDKPVGTVWFGVLSLGVPLQTGMTVLRETPSIQFVRTLGADRAAVRQRAESIGLDTLRRAILGLPIG